MTARILTFLLFVSTLNFAQDLPDAPKPRPTTKHAADFSSPKMSAKKKTFIFAGLGAVAATAITFVVQDRSKQKFIRACACPAQVPKK